MQSRGSVSPPTDEYGLEQSTNQREVSHPANLYQPSRHHHHHSPYLVYIFDPLYMPISVTAKYNIITCHITSSLTLDPHPPLSNPPPPPSPAIIDTPLSTRLPRPGRYGQTRLRCQSLAVFRTSPPHRPIRSPHHQSPPRRTHPQRGLYLVFTKQGVGGNTSVSCS